MVVGLLQHRLVGLFEEQSRSVLVEERGHAGDCVGGSLVVWLAEEELPVLKEPLQQGRDLRHRRIWRSLSVLASARVSYCWEAAKTNFNIPLGSLQQGDSCVDILICH